jgi:hypothetical protein
MTLEEFLEDIYTKAITIEEARVILNQIIELAKKRAIVEEFRGIRQGALSTYDYIDYRLEQLRKD